MRWPPSGGSAESICSSSMGPPRLWRWSWPRQPVSARWIAWVSSLSSFSLVLLDLYSCPCGQGGVREHLREPTRTGGFRTETPLLYDLPRFTSFESPLAVL